MLNNFVSIWKAVARRRDHRLVRNNQRLFPGYRNCIRGKFWKNHFKIETDVF